MTKLYTVKRDNICAGKVITDFEFNNNKSGIHGNGVDFRGYYPCRTMMFVENFDSKSEDLLYSTPRYPIYKGNNVEECESSKFIIAKSHNLGLLLKMLGYEEELDYYDVERIRKRLFNGKFPLENLEKFGLVEINPEQQSYYDEKGKLIVNQDILKKLIRKRKIELFFGKESEYASTDAYDGLPSHIISDIIIPQEYFYILRELGDHPFKDVLRGYEEKMNAFKPAKEEGLIRSLKKYD